MFPSVAEFLCYPKGLKPRGKIGAAFGSYGWAGGAINAIRAEMEQTGIDMVEPVLNVKWVSDDAGLLECNQLGKRVANRMK
jgi:flavorubredoxin